MREWKRLRHARLFGMALALFPLQLSQSCPRTAELGQCSCFCKLQTSGDIPLGSVGHWLFAPRADLGPGQPPGLHAFCWDCWCGLTGSWQGLVQALSEWTTKWVANNKKVGWYLVTDWLGIFCKALPQA